MRLVKAFCHPETILTCILLFKTQVRFLKLLLNFTSARMAIAQGLKQD